MKTSKKGKHCKPYNHKTKWLTKEVVIRIIKVIDIGYITTLYFSLGIMLAKAGDKITGEFSEENESKKSTFILAGELVLCNWIFGILFYVVRNIIPLIPFPLDNVYGFQHSRVKEVSSASVFAFAFLYYFKFYQRKVKYLYNRI